MTEELNKSITWNSRLEEYFCSTGEKAQSLAFIHNKAEQLYSNRRSFIELPVIVLSGVLGFLSVGSSSMFEGHENISSICIGLGSLCVSVLNTLNSYYQFSKKAENHRISAIQYGKLYRFLSIEMSLPRDQRATAYDLLTSTKETFDRLQEISINPPPEVIEEYKKKFGIDKYQNLSKPEIANGLEAIVPFDVKLHPSVMSLESPFSTYQDNPLNLRAQKSSPAPPENRLKVKPKEDKTHEPYSQRIDSTSDIRIDLPPILEA